jgi:hypothetical protein
MSFVICPRCQRGFRRPGNPKKCSECGSDLITRCPNPKCKAPIKSLSDKYCDNCGTGYFNIQE